MFDHVSLLKRSSWRSTVGGLGRAGTVCLALICLTLAGSRGALAQTDTVTVCATECDYTTIQAAVDAPGTGDGDLIEIRDPEHTEAGIVLGKSVTLIGTAPDGTVLQADPSPGAASDRVLSISEGAVVTVQDLVVRHGNVIGGPALGGGILNRGRLTLVRVAVVDNQAVGTRGYSAGDAHGGGIWSAGWLTVTRSTVSGNVAYGGRGDICGATGGTGYGGGISVEPGSMLRAVNSTISGNRAEGGYAFG